MIQTESTRNPNSLKFLSEKVISAIGTEEFQKEKSKDLKNKFVKEQVDKLKEEVTNLEMSDIDQKIKDFQNKIDGFKNKNQDSPE